MTYFSVVALLLLSDVVSQPPPSATADDPSAQQQPLPCKLTVPGQGHGRYDVMAPALPPTRTVLSFDAPGGRHVEIVWDPLQSSRLDRLVILEAGQTWRVSLSAEPQRDPNQGKFDY